MIDIVLLIPENCKNLVLVNKVNKTIYKYYYIIIEILK